MMVIDNKFNIGQIVYLKTDVEQLRRIVSSIRVFDTGDVNYQLVCGTIDTEHYQFEISETEDVSIKV